jgi:hypothetical protein
MHSKNELSREDPFAFHGDNEKEDVSCPDLQRNINDLANYSKETYSNRVRQSSRKFRFISR